MRHLARWSLFLTCLLVFRGWIVEQALWVADQAPGERDVAMLLRAVGALFGAPSLLAFLLFSRIDESRALENASRQRLREAIRAEPGLGLSQLSQRLGLGWGTTVYHLNRLERAGLVASSDVGRRRAFFLPEHGRKVRDTTALLANGAQVRLLQAALALPDASQQELARAAGLGLPIANRYLRRLEEGGFLVSRKEWRVRRYQVTERLRSEGLAPAQRELSPSPSGPSPVLPELSPRGTNAP